MTTALVPQREPWTRDDPFWDELLFDLENKIWYLLNLKERHEATWNRLRDERARSSKG